MRKYDTAEQRVLAVWSLDCAERVLHLFERLRPDDPRPRHALALGRHWVETGEFSMPVIRRASLDAHAAAKEVKSQAACMRGGACGRAGRRHCTRGTACLRRRLLRALKAIVADGERGGAMDRVVAERTWQEHHLPEPLRSEVMRRIVVEDRRSGPFVTVIKGPGF